MSSDRDYFAYAVKIKTHEQNRELWYVGLSGDVRKRLKNHRPKSARVNFLDSNTGAEWDTYDYEYVEWVEPAESHGEAQFKERELLVELSEHVGVEKVCGGR